MIKMLYRPLLAVLLLLLGVNATTAQDEMPLLYITDYAQMNDYYLTLDVTTGATQRFERPSGFLSYLFPGGEQALPAREDITSPYDNAVRFVLLRDYQAPNHQDWEQLYRVREDDQLEPVLSGEYIYIRSQLFTDNGRYVYLFEKTESGLHDNLYTLHRYDISSGELSIVAGRVATAGLDCQESWCELVSGMPRDENDSQDLYVLNKDTGDLRHLETAEEITIHIWQNAHEVLYTAYDGAGQTAIRTYRIDTEEYATLTTIPGEGIDRLYQTNDEWWMVLANAPENNRAYDVYIVNDLATQPTAYPLGIQTGSSWVDVSSSESGMMLMITYASPDYRLNDVYILHDETTTHPTVDQLTPADFDAEALSNVYLVGVNLGDRRLLQAGVSDDAWRYYLLDIATRTITPVVEFTSRQGPVQVLLSPDQRWLAVSIEERGEHYVGIVAMDGSQPLQTWDLGMDSYVCLLAWDAPGIDPPGCELYFGIG
jgi:hypothetical protein